MNDFESRQVIEALRSGIPSRSVGQYFAQSRPHVLEEISERMEKTAASGRSGGMVITGKYGEGKTHLLKTAFNMAHEKNMVVSYISLSKETPMDKLPLLYQKIVTNTYLPNHIQPGFLQELEKLTPNSSVGSNLLLYAMKNLQTDKLYYLLRSYMSTDDPDERFQMQADLEGDVISNAALRKIYKRLFGETVKFNVNFTKTKHIWDYYCFMSHLFRELGYDGWVILVDETELMGRLGKKARLNGYRNMAEFLLGKNDLKSVFTMFAMSASYIEDVIEGKHEYANLDEAFPGNTEPMETVLGMLEDAPQLHPLTQEEICNVFTRVIDFHARAYGWSPNVSVGTLMEAAKNGGYLLRTKIRYAIEYLDQLYQYGDAGSNQVSELSAESFEEESVSLDGLEIE